jgi:hypothetical protein
MKKGGIMKSEKSKKKQNFQEVLGHFMSQQKIPSADSLLKREFQGTLLPCKIWLGSKNICRYKLETASEEILLEVKDDLLAAAHSHLWEAVKVKGHFDPHYDVFKVERIISLEADSEFDSDFGGNAWLSDLIFELDKYKDRIRKNGMIESFSDRVAS